MTKEEMIAELQEMIDCIAKYDWGIKEIIKRIQEIETITGEKLKYIDGKVTF